MQLEDGLRKLMATTTSFWNEDPSLLTYGGGSRSRRNGIFAGVTDIQGMDMYVDPKTPYPIKIRQNLIVTMHSYNGGTLNTTYKQLPLNKQPGNHKSTTGHSGG